MPSVCVVTSTFQNKLPQLIQRMALSTVMPLRKNRGKVFVPVSHVHTNKKGSGLNTTNPSRQREGLVFSEDKIQRIWKSFDYYSNSSRERELSDRSTTFDLHEFLNKFPHVNPSLLLDLDSTNPPGEENKKTVKSDEMPHFNSHAMAAGEKLNRMIHKVNTYDLNHDILPRTQEFLVEEFETVIDLWVQAVKAAINYNLTYSSNDSGNIEDILGAVEAGLMASTLLERWEQEHLHGLRYKLELNNDPNGDNVPFYLPAPSISAYQNVIEAWWKIYSLDNSSSLTNKNLDQIRGHATSFLDMMMKRLNVREGVQNSLTDDNDNQILNPLKETHTYKSIEPLNGTCEKVIWMWTCNSREKKDIHVQFLMKCVGRATSILEGMESVYNENVASLSSKNKEGRNSLLSTIRPTTSIYNSVLVAYSQIGIVHGHLPAIEQADKILRRIEPDQSYIVSDTNSTNHDQKYDTSSKPNKESYEAVIDAWSSISTPEARTRVDELVKLKKMIH